VTKSERSFMEQRLDQLLANGMARTDKTRAHLKAELASIQKQHNINFCQNYKVRIHELKWQHRIAASAYNQRTPSRRPLRHRFMTPFSLTLTTLPLSTTLVGLRSMYLSYGLWSVTVLFLMQLAHASFEPYQDNGGLVCAVAGKNFAIIASDTRMIGVGGYLLESRNHLSSRLWSVEDDMIMVGLERTLRSDTTGSSRRTKTPISKCLSSSPASTSHAPIMVGSSGCSTDCSQLQKVVRADIRASSYFGQMSRWDANQVANVVSQTLYSRRGFPYYVFCVVSGLDTTEMDHEGYCRGKVYVYDAIGSYEQVAVAVAGTGRELLQPILDNLLDCQTTNDKVVEGSVDNAMDCLCKAYRAVSEREIGVGDNLVLHVSEKVDGEVHLRVLVVPLKEH
jgi:20S proteasome subunit beta 6